MVFKAKVLQKLYPAITTLQREQNLSAIAEDQATTVNGKRKSCGEDGAFGEAVKLQNAASLCRRMYTVLPPPPGYNVHSEKYVTPPHLESIDTAEDPAGESVHRSSEEADEEKEAEDQRRRRRRKKKKPAPPLDSGKNLALVSDRSGQRVPVDEGGERISRNKKRKLKKKRHKDKLLSLGLMPQAAALEFTYSKDGEEEDNKRKAAELSEFLRTTLEIYMSDSSPHVVKTSRLSATVDGLLRSLASGSKPNSVLSQLYSLKTFIQQNEAGSLEMALIELNNNTYMSPEEASAVVSLFKYWITEILPMQRDETTRLPTTQ
ncbi:glutamate-rich protein 1 isoform X2 [Girardinichthys multiradiatus]|uniref:glutamate-rich protein 1 isoform X2 n=1 Tax=Girardinichthys multiradiatus TaxID=208333 RepID=UPI001FAD11D8|nr:glutamate-rich protein 1 isoform X2 [Girardinichthys multiradiatus]